MHNTPGSDKDLKTTLKTKILFRLAVLGTSLGLAFAVSLTGAILAAYHFSRPGLPEAATVRDIPLQVPLRVYSRDGRLIQEIGEQRRILVAYDNIPPFVVQAFLAAEDDRFFTHPGIDYQGVLRAAWKNILSGRRGQGASTLTQQLARDYFLSRERSFIRKIKEAFLAYKIEQEFSKQEIMEMFLNKMFFGQRAYGVAAAAQVYFGKTLEQLNIAEAATLAGILQRPSDYNPVNGPESSKRRRSYVLRRMQELEYIDANQWQAAMDHPMLSKLHAPDIELSAPYLAEMVRRDLMNKYGSAITSRGYRVFTTIDSKMQNAANYAVRDGLLEYDRRHGYRGALASLDLENVDSPAIEQALADFPTPAGLQTALVLGVDTTRNSASLRLSGDRRVALPWTGMNWAAGFIDRNRIHAKPESVTEVVSPGDVIYVIETVTGDYALAQIPEAQGALVALNPQDGSIAALTGGFDYATSKFNRVTQARRQPGSSFKPFIYSAALANGFTPASIINDAPVVIESSEYEGVWRPKNSTGRFYGEIRLREALVRSMNLVSVRMVLKMGVGNALRHIRQFGFSDEALPRNLSLALGSGAVPPLELARGYSVLANGGYAVEPYYIDRIELAEGEVLEIAAPKIVCDACEQGPAAATNTALNEPGQPAFEQIGEQQLAGAALTEFWGQDQVAPRILPATNIWLIQSMMRDVIQRGTGRRARTLGRTDLAGKTGTSNDLRDAWFGGYNPDLVAVSWVGFDNDEPLGAGEEGGRTALPMWIHFMRDALDGAPQRNYPQPPGLVTVRIAPDTGELAGATATNFIFETFEDGTQPRVVSDGPLATPFDDAGEAIELEDVF